MKLSATISNMEQTTIVRYEDKQETLEEFLKRVKEIRRVVDEGAA